MPEKQQLIPMAGADTECSSMKVHKFHLEFIRRINLHHRPYLSSGKSFGWCGLKQSHAVELLNGT